MLRFTLLLTCLSATAFAQTAAQVCAKILYADQKVACVRTIAGHDVEPEAAQRSFVLRLPEPAVVAVSVG